MATLIVKEKCLHNKNRSKNRFRDRQPWFTWISSGGIRKEYEERYQEMFTTNFLWLLPTFLPFMWLPNTTSWKRGGKSGNTHCLESQVRLGRRLRIPEEAGEEEEATTSTHFSFRQSSCAATFFSKFTCISLKSSGVQSHDGIISRETESMVLRFFDSGQLAFL